jgi:ribosomal protein S18 acetylase RimI-like enzyme
VRLREATPEDAPELAGLFVAARTDAMPYLPQLHPVAETHAFVASLVADGGTWLVERDGAPVGFLVLRGAHVEQLYVHPAHQRSGVGSRLLRHAQCLRPDGLELFVFQRNTAARAFYAVHGFTVARLTDGAGNEEREPDALLVWAGPGG